MVDKGKSDSQYMDNIFKLTGNPFIDLGTIVLKNLIEKDNIDKITKEDLEKEIDKLVEIYSHDKWRKCIFSIFPNSPLTQPHYIGNGTNVEKHKSKLMEYFKSIEPLDSNGSCLGCGSREGRFKLKKAELPLTGSAAHRSSFPAADEGLPFCGACALSIQFSPLGYYKSAGKFLVPQSNSHELIDSWVNLCLKNLKSQRISGNYSGCNHAQTEIPENAIYLILSEVISKTDKELENNTTVRIFHFTNYNQGPEMKLYEIPSNLFEFLSVVMKPKYKSAWMNIITQGFDNSKVNTEEKMKNKKNEVIIKLFNNESILKYFVSDRQKKAFGDWDLLSYYMAKVENMDEKSLEIVKEVADKICETAKKTESDKRVNQLQQANTYEGFRGVLLNVQKDRVNIGLEETLISIDEINQVIYEEDYSNWKLIRDLLLFRCYENLNEWLIEKNKKEGE